MIIDDINLSIKIILRNKFRTFIAIIGIVTGVSLLIVTFSLLKIGEMKILSNIDKIFWESLSFQFPQKLILRVL